MRPAARYIRNFPVAHDGSMVLLYMVPWIPSIYPSHVSIYTSTMDPSWVVSEHDEETPFGVFRNQLSTSGF